MLQSATVAFAGWATVLGQIELAAGERVIVEADGDREERAELSERKLAAQHQVVGEVVARPVAPNCKTAQTPRTTGSR